MLISGKTKSFKGRQLIPPAASGLLMIAALAAIAIFASCVTALPRSDYTFPEAGSTNNAMLTVKDYQSLGVIFVTSTEMIDGNGNHTGSKITYEMLMREAIKLGADDVINIKIDVNEVQEVISSANGTGKVLKTTYKYTANALAIKYTDAMQGGVSASGSSNKLAEIPPTQGPPQKSGDRFNLNDKRIFAVSATGSYGAGWTAGGTITVWEKHKPDAFITPSFFITAKYLEAPSDHSNHYWHPHLYTGGAGILLKHKLRSNERFILSAGASFEYLVGKMSHYNDSFLHEFDGDHRHVEGFNSPGSGIQFGVSYRITPNISLDLNGMGKFSFVPIKCDRHGENFGDHGIAMGGGELGITFTLPY